MEAIIAEIFPMGLLRKMKWKMISNSFDRLEEMEIIPYEPGYYKNGVNFIGNIKVETGLGQSCRLVASALKQTGIPMGVYQYNWEHRRQVIHPGIT